MADPVYEAAQKFLLESLAQAAAEVFSQALSSTWTVSPGTEAIQEQDIGGPCFSIAFNGNICGTVDARVSNESALILASKFLGEPAPSSTELSADHKDALEELMRQLVGRAVTTLRSRFGEIKTEVTRIEPPVWHGFTAGLTATETGASSLLLALDLSPELIKSLASEPAPVPVKNPSAQPGKDEIDVYANKARLSGVKLKLSLRFGTASLTLRELTELGSGSVVDLDRRLHDPVDLLLGGRVLAKGDVVVVAGNYGIRVTEIPAATG
jgi:flagellar motor switch protein FliN/FliY